MQRGGVTRPDRAGSRRARSAGSRCRDSARTAQEAAEPGPQGPGAATPARSSLSNRTLQVPLPGSSSRPLAVGRSHFRWDSAQAPTRAGLAVRFCHSLLGLERQTWTVRASAGSVSLWGGPPRLVNSPLLSPYAAFPCGGACIRTPVLLGWGPTFTTSSALITALKAPSPNTVTVSRGLPPANLVRRRLSP